MEKRYLIYGQLLNQPVILSVKQRQVPFPFEVQKMAEEAKEQAEKMKTEPLLNGPPPVIENHAYYEANADWKDINARAVEAPIRIMGLSDYNEMIRKQKKEKEERETTEVDGRMTMKEALNKARGLASDIGPLFVTGADGDMTMIMKLALPEAQKTFNQNRVVDAANLKIFRENNRVLQEENKRLREVNANLADQKASAVADVCRLEADERNVEILKTQLRVKTEQYEEMLKVNAELARECDKLALKARDESIFREHNRRLLDRVQELYKEVAERDGIIKDCNGRIDALKKELFDLKEWHITGKE